MSSEESLVLIGQSVPGKATECLTASQSQFPGLGQTGTVSWPGTRLAWA